MPFLSREGSFGVVMQYFPVFEALQARPEFKALLDDAGLRLDVRLSG